MQNHGHTHDFRNSIKCHGKKKHFSHYHRINAAKLQAMAEQGASRLHLTNAILWKRTAHSSHCRKHKCNKTDMETAKDTSHHFTSLHHTSLHHENENARESSNSPQSWTSSSLHKLHRIISGKPKLSQTPTTEREREVASERPTNQTMNECVRESREKTCRRVMIDYRLNVSK